MALGDFYGGYEVEATCSAGFGMFSFVNIEAAAADSGYDASVTITPYNLDFTSLDEGRVQSFDATYDNTMDALNVDMRSDQGRAMSMFIARYSDSNPDIDYQTIYSVTRLKIDVNNMPAFRHAPVWTAKKVLAVEPTGVVESRDVSLLEEKDFYGTYTVRSAANAQFGTFSTLEIGDPKSDGETVMRIRSAGGGDVSETKMTFDSEMSCLVGNFTAREHNVTAVVALSLSSLGGLDEADPKRGRILYGSVAIDDPEQGGTFGAEDDDSGTGPDGGSLIR